LGDIVRARRASLLVKRSSKAEIEIPVIYKEVGIIIVSTGGMEKL
jgi:hypothetical protein